MKWWQFNWNGWDRERQQREESLSRIADAGVETVTRARMASEQASRDVSRAAEQRIEAGRPVRKLLKDLIQRLNTNERLTSLRKDHA